MHRLLLLHKPLIACSVLVAISDRKKMKFFLLLSVCAVHLLTVQAAAVAEQECGQLFQSQLRQLMATKRSCNSASFYDCCQVK